MSDVRDDVRWNNIQILSKMIHIMFLIIQKGPRRIALGETLLAL